LAREDDSADSAESVDYRNPHVVVETSIAAWLLDGACGVGLAHNLEELGLEVINVEPRAVAWSAEANVLWWAASPLASCAHLKIVAASGTGWCIHFAVTAGLGGRIITSRTTALLSIKTRGQPTLYCRLGHGHSQCQYKAC